MSRAATRTAGSGLRLLVGVIAAALCLIGAAGVGTPKAEAVGDYWYQLANQGCAGGQSNMNGGYGVMAWNATVNPGSYCQMGWGNTGPNAGIFKLHLNPSRDYSGTGSRVFQIYWNDFTGLAQYGDGEFVTHQEPYLGSVYNANVRVAQAATRSYSAVNRNYLATGGDGVYAHVGDWEGPGLSAISVSCPSGGANGWCRGGSATATFTSSDNYLGRQPTYLHVDGGVVEGWDQAWTTHSTTVNASEGVHTFQARRAGDGWPTAARDDLFRIDGSAPADPTGFTLTPAVGGGTQTVTAGWGVSDAVSGADNGTVEVNSATDGSASGTWSAVCTSAGSGNGARSCAIATGSLAQGTHLVRVRYADLAGNLSGYATTTMVVDQTAPSVPAVSGGSASWVAGPATLSASGSTDTGGSTLAGYRYRASNDGGENWVVGGADGNAGDQVTIADGGDWVVQFRAADAVGNLSAWSASAQARVDRLAPSVPAVSGGSAAWSSAPSLTLTASGSSDAQSPPVSYQSRTSTDGGATWSAPVAGASRQVSDAGETLVQFRALDALGNPSAWAWAGTDAVRADAPLAYYRMDDHGASLADSSGNGRSGVWVGGPTLEVPGRPGSGDASTAARITGATSYGTVPAPPITNAFSFELWMRLDAITGGYQTILDRGACCGESYALYVGPSGELHGATYAGSSRQTFTTAAGTVGAGSWYHLVWTYDGATQKLYLNGNTSPVASVATSGAVVQNPAQLLIGRRAGDVTPFAGTLDELAIYGQALSPARVAAHYAAGPAFPAGTARIDRAAPSASLTGGSLDWRNDASVTLTASGSDDAGAGGLSFSHRVSRDGGATWLSPVAGGSVVVPSPAGVPDLALWLRADRVSGADGDPVASWSDTSAAGRDANQPTAAYRPTLKDGAIGGQPALRFDGADDFLTNPSLSLGAQVSVFAVARPQSASAGRHRRIINNESNLYLGSFDNAFASFYGNNAAWGTTANHGASAALTPGSPYVLSSVNNGTDTAYINGVQVGSRSNPMGAFSDGYQVGCLVISGSACYGPDQQAWAGDIAEIIVFNRALGTAERQEVERYLLDKYDMSVPVSHRSAGEGTTLVQARATDRSGQSSPWSPAHAGAPASPDAPATVRIDRTAPSAPAVSGGSVTWQNVASVTVSASGSSDGAGSGVAGYERRTSTDRGQTWSAPEPGASYTQTAEGETLVRFRAVDAAGNASVWMDAYPRQVAADAPAVHYRFGETSGTSIADASGRGANGTLAGAGTSLGQPGNLFAEPDDRSLGLAGSGGYVVTPNLLSTTGFPSTSTTIEVWFRADGPGVVVTELGNATPNTGWHDSQIEVTSGGVVRGQMWNLSPMVLGTITYGTWHHAVVRFDAASNKLDGFLDGVKVSGSSGVARQAPYQNGYALHYGLGAPDTTHMGSGAALTGAIDEFAAYPSALSDARIAARYQSGIGAPGLIRIERDDPNPPTVSGGSLSWRSVPSITFTASGSTPGSGLAGYQVRTSTDGGATWSAASNAPGGTFSVSAKGQTLVQMRARSNSGRLSLWAPAHASAPGAPDAAGTARIDRSAPSAPTVSGGSMDWVSGGVVFTASGAADTGGAGIAGHEIRIRAPGEETWGEPEPFAGSTVTVTTEGRSRIQIRAVDGAGNTSAWSPSYPDTVLADLPRAYWRLGETSGPAADSSGFGFPLTVGAAATRGVEGLVASEPDRATVFSGTGAGQATTSATLSFLGATDASLEAWVKIPALPAKGTFVKVGGANGWGVGIGGGSFDDAGAQLIGLYENVAWVGSGWSFPGPGTYHVVMTIDGAASARFYVDGALVATRTGLPSPGAPTGGAGVGGYAGTRSFAGTIDEAAVYPSALSAGQVAAHYAAANTTANVASIDNAPPSDPSVSGGSLAWRNVASVTLTASGSADSGSGLAGYEYRISTDGGATWTAPEAGQAITVSAEGETLVQFRTRDVMGNISAWVPGHSGSPEAAGTVRIDRSAPVAPAVSGTPLAWTNGTVSFTATGSDPGGVARFEYRTSTDGGPWTAPAEGQSLSVSAEGVTRVQFRIIDRAGKASPWTWATPDRVRELSPALYYRLGDAGPVAVDHSGQGRDGAYNGGSASAAAAPVVADEDGSRTLDGAAWVEVPSSGIFTSRSFSVAAWVRVAALSGDQTILAARSADASGKSLSLVATAAGAVRVDFGGQPRQSDPGLIAAGDWHHVVLSYDASSGARRIHVDGAEAASDNVPAFTGTDPVVRIGQSATGTDGFSGQIDELAVFEGALSGTEAADLSAAGPAFAPGTARIDRTPPAIPVPASEDVDSGSWTNADEVTISVDEVSDAGGSGYAHSEYRTSTDGVAWGAPQIGTELTLTEPGHVFVAWRALDVAGNASAWSAPYEVGIDREAPDAPGISGGSDDWQNVEGITLSATAPEAVSGAQIDRYESQVSADGGTTWADLVAGQTRRVTDEGDRRVRFRIVDAAGNPSGWSSAEAVGASRARIDRSAPSQVADLVVDPEARPNGFHTDDEVTVTADLATDTWSGVAGYQHRISRDDGESWSSGSGRVITIAAEGEVIVAVRATDNVGIAGPWRTVTIKLDNVAPRLGALSFSPGPGSDELLYWPAGANTVWFNADETGSVVVSAEDGSADGGYPGGVNTNWASGDGVLITDQAFDRATYRWSAGAPGVAQPELVATDAAGLAGAAPAGFNLMADSDAPALTLVTPAGQLGEGDAVISAPESGSGVRILWTATDEGAGLRGPDSGFGEPARANGVVLERRSLAAADESCRPASAWDGAAWIPVALGEAGTVPATRTRSMRGAVSDTGVTLTSGEPVCFQWRLSATDAVGHATVITSGRVLVTPSGEQTDLSGSAGSTAVFPGGEIHLHNGSEQLRNRSRAAGTVDLLGRGADRARVFLNDDPQALDPQATPDPVAVLEAAQVFIRALRGFTIDLPAPRFGNPDLEAAIDSPDDPWRAEVPAANRLSGAEAPAALAGVHVGDYLVDGDLELTGSRSVTIKGSLIVLGDLRVAKGSTLRLLKPKAAHWRRPGLVVATPGDAVAADAGRANCIASVTSPETTACLKVEGFTVVQGLLWAEQGSVPGGSTLRVSGSALFGILDGSKPQPGEVSLVQTGRLRSDWTPKVLGLRGAEGEGSSAGLGGVRVEGVVSVTGGG